MKFTSFLLALICCFTISCNDDQNCVATSDDNCECYEIYQPVCGCDDVTYSNDCFAECVGITDYTEGVCPADCQGEVIDDCFCTAEYDPVCGCDGKTYGNSCNAYCAGINDYTTGECP